jgi:hypothetical protein
MTGGENGGFEVSDCFDRRNRVLPIPRGVPGRAGQALTPPHHARKRVDLEG